MMPRFICYLLIHCGASVAPMFGICAWQRSVWERKVFGRLLLAIIFVLFPCETKFGALRLTNE